MAQKATLEFAPGAGNPTGNGPTAANQVITFQNNTDNPTGNTFSAYTPAVTATFSLTQPAGSQTTSFGGSNGNNLPLFPHLNNPFNYYSDNTYTSSNAVAPGTGITQSVNSSVGIFNAEAGIPASSPSTPNARYQYATLTITFSQNVVNPVIQVTDLGGAFTNTAGQTLGFTTDLDLATTGVTLSRLSGSSAGFVVSANQIRNTNPTLGTAATFVSGSALVTTPAAGIRTVQFNLYLHGDGGAPFEAGTTGLSIGDLFLVGVSQQTPPADVATSVTASANTVAAGQPLSFNVTYTNAGPGTATDYTQSLQITPGLGASNVTFANLPAGVTATYNNATGVVSFTGTPVSLASGVNQNLTVNIASVPTGLASVTASTTVGTSVFQGADTGANSATSTVAVAPITDVATTLSGPTSVTQGNQVTLNVTTSNLSNVTALNVVQTVQLVGGLTNVFVSNNGTYDKASGLVTYPTLVSLGGGQTVGNYVSYSAPAPALAFAPVAMVTPNTAATGDSNPANNTAYLNGATTATNLAINAIPANAPLANLSTTITPSALSVSPGTSVTFTVRTANAGPGAAANVVETVQLLPGLTALQINGAGATGPGAAGSNELLFANGNKYNTVTGLVTFASIPSLGSAGSASNTLTFAAPANVGGQLLATASVGSPTPDPVAADNLSSAKITILPTADLSATLTGPATVAAGQPVAYTATFTNNGPATVAGPAATVQLPAGLTNVSLVGGGTYNPATGVVTFPSLDAAPGVARSYSIVFTPLTAGTYNALAAYTSATPDGVLANNTARATTTVTAATLADLSVKLSGTTATTLGGAITYVAQTTNNGPSTASAVVTTIQLPMNLQGTISGPANATYDPGTGVVTFTNGALANGATVSNYVTYQNNNDPATNPSPFVSVARVSSPTTDPNPNNNTSAAVTTGTTPDNTPGNNIDLSTTLATNAGALGVNAGNTFTLTPTFTSNSNPMGPVSEVLYLPSGTQVAPSANFTYDSNSGVLTFANTMLRLNANGVPIPDTYTVTVTAPNTGPFTAISAISGSNFDSNAANNSAARSVTINPAYDEVTSVSGPAAALPGVASTYTVQTINNGPINAGTVVQTVTLPVGVMATNITGGGMQVGTLITFPSFTNQAPGAGTIVTNTFIVTMPASGNLPITANVTATGDVNPNNNSSSLTTTQANQAPVANSLVNALQAPRGSTSGKLPISSLVATDANTNGTIAGYQLTSIPNAATQGTLYYNNGGTLTAITSATQPLTPTQAMSLSFAPAAGYVGNVFFGYTATNNAGTVSLPALFTIQVGQDTNSMYLVLVRGGSNPYQNGNSVATVFDVNGGQYTSVGDVSPAVNGNGVTAASLPTTGPPSNPTNALPPGIGFNTTTGEFTVVDRTLLRTGSYVMRITTVDLFGGTNTQDIALVIGANPLPVELAAFTATAVRNVDAQLTWRTASEKSNDRFDVERSLNGTDFVKIGQVKGQGNATAPTDYALTDAGIGAKATGPVYYRLQQVDADGTRTYSPVRTVAFAKTQAASFTLYPNPATTTATLDLAHLPAGTYQLTVLDLTGRRVLSAPLDALAPRVDLRSLSQGAYLVQITGTADGQFLRLTQRLTKE